MPIKPTYPGVYIEEIPSGVRTIIGVSTSVTALLGMAKRGPIDRAVRILNWGEFEERFGGLHPGAYMPYAVRQFFLNGGAEAWVIRLSGAVATAHEILLSATDHPTLTLTARDAGSAGNAIEVTVDYDTANPASTFNLTLNYNPLDAPNEADSERFENLSMNSADPNFVDNELTASKLVEAVREAHLGRTRLSPEVAQSLIAVASGEPSPGDDLTPREREVLALLVEGLTNKEIAQRLIISLSTARAHVSNILSKLEVTNRVEAVSLAMREGLVD